MRSHPKLSIGFILIQGLVLYGGRGDSKLGHYGLFSKLSFANLQSPFSNCLPSTYRDVLTPIIVRNSLRRSVSTILSIGALY